MHSLDPYIVEIVEKMMQCREPNGLGYCKFSCPDHPNQTRVVPYTCKTKICNTCAAIMTDMWSEELKRKFPKGQYLHVTLTMPQEFREFFDSDQDPDWERKSDLYDLGWKAINGFLKLKNYIGGCFTMLHTYGRQLNLNPHLHIVLPKGALKKRKNSKHGKHGEYKWIDDIFLAREYVAVAWKKNLLQYILELTPYFKGNADQIIRCLTHPDTHNLKKITQILNTSVPKEEHEKWLKVFNIDYYINIRKRTAYQQTVCYIARYTKRLPIAQSRITNWDKENMMVTWTHVPHDGSTTVSHTMHVYEFFDKILQHIAPKNFKLSRYYGIFSNKKSRIYLLILEKLCQFEAPKPIPTWRERQLKYTGEDPLICPCCKKPLIPIEKAYRNLSGHLQIVSIPNV